MSSAAIIDMEAPFPFHLWRETEAFALGHFVNPSKTSTRQLRTLSGLMRPH
jgi:hypothetical protein